MNRSILAAAAAFATLATFSAAGPAFAHPAQSSVEVSFADLNLDSSAGQARLDTRIRSAVRSVCGNSTGRRSLREMQATARCMREAGEAARLRVAAARSNGQFGG